MRNAIITGANGFIGNILTKKLLDCGVTVTAIDLPETDKEFISRKGVSFLGADLNNLNSILNDIPFDTDVLYHLAWRGVKADLRNDYNLQISNLNLCINIINMAFIKRVKKIIMLGSASQYIKSNEPINGYNQPSPIEAYGAVKHAAFIICKTLAEQNKMNLIWTTVTSLYGPGRDDNNVLSYAIKMLLKGDKPSFTPLEQIWDYIYIDDFINALYLIGLYGHAGKNYAIANGDARVLKDYITVIRDNIDPSLPLGVGEIQYKDGFAENSIFNIDELKMDTGFYPKYSFEDGIINVINYFRDNNK